jgi:hypothetical protein
MSLQAGLKHPGPRQVNLAGIVRKSENYSVEGGIKKEAVTVNQSIEF